MLTLFKTNTTKDASNYIFDCLKKVEKHRLDIRHIIIVPDRASLEAERQLLNTLGGSFNIQVLTFRRFANIVLPQYKYLTKQSAIIALSAIISDNKEKLVCYTKGFDSLGFAENVYETISQLKYCKISPKALSEKSLPKSLEGKLKDIALIFELYQQFLQGGYIDSADKINLLIDALYKNQMVQNSFFYLYDFDNFSLQELSIIENLLKFSKGVTVACCQSDEKSQKHLFLNDIFDGVLQAAKNAQSQVSIVQGNAHTNKFTQQISKYLFSYQKITPIENDGFATIFEGTNRVQEVYALACQVQKFVRQGRRFRDVFVITSDINKYSNAISTVFEEFEIPYYCDRQVCLSNHVLVQFLVDFITMQKNNMQLVDVLSVAKNPFFDQCVDDVFKFENYCLKYNISYNFDTFKFGQHDDADLFCSAQIVREKLVSLAKQVQFKPTDSVRNYLFEIQNLISKQDLFSKNQQFAVNQTQQGWDFESKVTSQVQQKLTDTLLQIDDILGGRVVKLEDFLKTLKTALSSVNISAIPLQNDCVVFANMAKARKHDIKFLALLGANQREMPMVKSDCKLLNDQNISLLKQSGILLEPQISVENKRERFSLYQLLLEPSEKLHVSYSATDGKDNLLPSMFVNQISAMFLQDGLPLTSKNSADEDVYTVSQTISKLVLNLRKLADNQQVKMPLFNTLYGHFRHQVDAFKYSKNARYLHVEKGQQLFLQNSQTSVSKITDFFNCPHKFFFNYGLKLKTREVAELTSQKLGIILHNVLEKYVKQMDKNEDDVCTQKKAKDIFELILKEEVLSALSTDPSMKKVLDLLQDECVKMCLVIKDQLKNSRFECFDTEFAFGKQNIAKAVEVKFDGGSFLLNGIVDRIDIFEDKFIIIDYKSGANASVYNENALYGGGKLQLLVYLKAVMENLPKKYFDKNPDQPPKQFDPVGFYYFYSHNNFSDEKQAKVYSYCGRTIADVEIAKQIDTNLKDGFSQTLGLKLKKDGDLSKSSNAVTKSQLDSQIDYAMQLIATAGKLMQQGYIAVNPYEKVCDFCEFKEICDFNDIHTYKPRKHPTGISASTIEDLVSKQKEGQS